jgi:hypothetical protein
MTEENTPKPKGGHRDGAGRKPKDRVATKHITLKLRRDFIELIDAHYEVRSDFIQRAVKEKLRREGLI